MKIRSVGLCVKADHPESGGTVRGLEKWLAARGLRVELDEDAGEAVGRAGRPHEPLAGDVDLLVVLGGDGTLLSVARAAGRRTVPILGVNLGTLGYLTEIALDELYAAFERVLAGDVTVEARMRLDVEAERAGRSLGCWLALNDAVVTSLSLARMIDVEASADGRALTTYHADGIIVATPTGSTAYSLSAGGPILDPALDDLVVTPISPHTLTHRPLVLPGRSVIEMRPRPRAGSLHLTVDGYEATQLEEGDLVRVSRSAHPVSLVTSPFRTRFEILRAKLHWGER